MRSQRPAFTLSKTRRPSISSSVMLLGAIALPSMSMAQQAVQSGPLEQVVVTATRANEGLRTDVLGSSVTVLAPEQLEQRQTRVISDVLRDVPGVAVSRTGAVGGLTQVRVRGTEGNHVLVLIDGMEAADPYYGEFDFATLIADDVARVEVLRGQQSALYGSDAIGGIIHYMTVSGREAPGLSARIEGGSFNTWEGATRFAGATEKLDYSFSAGHQTTDGVPTSFFGTRKVGAENTAASGRLQYDVSDDFRLKAIARYTYTDAETNDTDYSSPYGTPPYGWVIDSDDYYRNKALYGFVSAEFDALDDRWVNTISLQGVGAGRDGYSGGQRSYGNEGARLKASYVSSFAFGSDVLAQTLTVAADFEREQMQNTGPGINAAQAIKREIDNIGLVAQYNAVFDERIGFGLALRRDDNDRFENADTYRVQGSYRFDTGTRLRAAAGSGIKNPSMSELYGYNPDTFIGNPDLKPERSEGWEVGAEQSFAAGRALIGVTYFDSRLKDEIYTVYSGPTFIASSANRATESTQRGVEVFAAARLGAWSLDASYTHLDANENGVEEIRRPPHIGSLSIGWRTLADALGLNVTARYNGTMLDNNFTGVGPSRIEMADFTLVNFNADYRITQNVQVYGRVENLFDEEYQEVYTFRPPGRAAYAGVRVKF
jgi:vitamin B12 transporter